MDEISPESEEPGNPSGADVAEGRRSRRQLARTSVVVAVVVVVLDQLSKNWAVSTLSDGVERHVIWTLQWNLSYNTGMAFSRGRGLGPGIALLALLVVIVLVVSASHMESRLARCAAGLLIGGACGNLADRMFRGDGLLQGAVVDFIDFQWWPIFNIADMGVSIGAVLFALASFRVPKSHRGASTPMSVEGTP
jgi:signal peptidase II